MTSKKRIQELQDKFKTQKPISYEGLQMAVFDAAMVDHDRRDKWKKNEAKVKKQLAIGEVRIDSTPYYIYKIKDDYTGKVQCLASPLGNGDDAFSGEDWSSYRMTHGGSQFRKAAEICDEIYSDKNR